MDAADLSTRVSTVRKTAADAGSSRRPSICVVAHRAYGAMTGGRSGHAGGVEHQTALTARWLATRGYDVQLVVWREGAGAEEEIDGVRVIKTCAEGAGAPGLRFFHPRWTTLEAALAAADADLYYHNCAEYVTGQIAWWCQRHQRRFVFSVASDPECDPALPLMQLRERVLYRYGLRRADAIIVQTRRQQQMLREGFGLESTVLPMPCPAIDAAGPETPAPGPSPRIVWVGRMSPEKRLEMLAAVAAELPDVRFEVIGPAADDAATAGALGQPGALANVVLRGRVPRDEMPAVYRGATALLCTSIYEGFPNTFLEAWGHGVPIVSTIDPDGLLTGHGLGFTAADASGLAAQIRRLVESASLWQACSERSREYCVAHHRVERALPRFERVFLDALGTMGSLAGSRG